VMVDPATAVIGDGQDRRRSRGVGEEGERAPAPPGTDGRRRRVSSPKAAAEGEPLRVPAGGRGPPQDRAKELVEARERQVRLGTDADGSQDPQARGFGRLDGVAEQGRFPRSRHRHGSGGRHLPSFTRPTSSSMAWQSPSRPSRPDLDLTCLSSPSNTPRVWTPGRIAAARTCIARSEPTPAIRRLGPDRAVSSTAPLESTDGRDHRHASAFPARGSVGQPPALSRVCCRRRRSLAPALSPRPSLAAGTSSDNEHTITVTGTGNRRRQARHRGRAARGGRPPSRP
jgi:hypothetical protein